MMASRDALKEVLLQLKNLKLSSPLRADQNKDENKENVLAGQDIEKSKTEENGQDDIGIVKKEENTQNQSNCHGIDVNSYAKSEGFSPANCLIKSSSNTHTEIVTSEDNLDSIIHNSGSFVNEKNATVTSSEVNYFDLFGPNQPEQNCTLTNCVEESSIQSLYDDCVDLIEKTSEEYSNHSKSSPKVSDLNSTYAVEEQSDSFQKPEELPCVEEPSQSNTQIDANTLEAIDIFNNTQVIEEGHNIKIIEDEKPSLELSGRLDCEKVLQSEIPIEKSDIISEQSERCDHTYIENSKHTKPLREEKSKETLTSGSILVSSKSVEVITDTEKISVELEYCEDFDVSLSNSVEQNNSGNSSNSEQSLLDITKINCSVENLEKSTAKLVSDSSNGSLNTSLNSTNLSESITNNSNLHGPTSEISLNQETEANRISEQIECSEKLDSSLSDYTTQVVNKSASAFIVLTPPNPEKSETFSEAYYNKDNSTEILEQPLCKISCTSTQSCISSINNTAEKQVEQTNCSAVHSEDLKLSSLGDNEHSSSLAQKVEEGRQVEKKIQETSSTQNTKMEEINEKLQQEFSDTKLELNAVQQAKATLELEISKKDEIILKTQAEAMKKEQQYIQEIKVLKEQLKEKANNINEKDLKDSKDSLKDLEQALKEAKAKEVDVMKVLEEYEKTIATRFADYKKLKEENATVNRHLSNLELSFSDLHQKYEKAKSVIYSYKKNEEKLRNAIAVYDETFIKQEGRYESLKAHAQTQIDKCNVEIIQQKEKSDSEISKLKAIVKRLEIKIAALETSLEQKTKECIDLAALCDEVTGKKF